MAADITGINSENRFPLYMIMAATGISFLIVVVLAMANVTFNASKEEQKKQARFDELKQQYEQEVFQGRHDPLTSLLNKRSFHDDLVRLAAMPETEVVYMSMDIQGFKAVNDRISHLAGDQGLSQYGELLTTMVAMASAFKHGSLLAGSVGRSRMGMNVERAMASGFVLCECKAYRTGGAVLMLASCAGACALSRWGVLGDPSQGEGQGRGSSGCATQDMAGKKTFVSQGAPVHLDKSCMRR